MNNNINCENMENSEENPYRNCDINDFSNPFKVFKYDFPNKDNQTNINNNYNNNNFNDNIDNDFSNPSKGLKFEEQ